MSFAMRLRVTFPEGRTEEATTSPGDYVRLERQYKIKASELTEPSTEWLGYLTWTALRRQGVDAGDDFEGFLDRMVDLEVEDDGGGNGAQGEGEAGRPPAS